MQALAHHSGKKFHAEGVIADSNKQRYQIIALFALKRIETPDQLQRIVHRAEFFQIISAVFIIAVIRCEYDLAAGIQHLIKAFILIGSDIDIVNHKQSSVAKRRQQFQIFMITLIIICVDRIIDDIGNNRFQAALIEIVADVLIFLLMLFNVSTDKLAFADTCNSCNDRCRIFRNNIVQLFQFIVTTAEILARQDVLAVPEK